MRITTLKITTLLLFLGFFGATSAVAEDIYKSVDDNGKVTYSSTPPANTQEASKVEITPPPSAADIKAAKEQQERNQKTADMLDENRKQRGQATAEDNRLKRENQKQSQLQQDAENNNENRDYGYPYYPGRYPAGGRPIKPGPVKPRPAKPRPAIPRPTRPMISPR